MLTPSRRLVRSSRALALALLLTLIGGLSAPFTPTVYAATAPAQPSGSVELSPTPPNQTQAVPPNIAVTFDDSGSMASDYMGDTPPFGTNKAWGDGPWYCAGVIDPTATSGLGSLAMNGVYYNPNVVYTPPVNADGSAFPAADSSLQAVQNDGVTSNRPLNPSNSSTTPFANKVTVTGSGKNQKTTTTYWNCQYDGSNTKNTNKTSPVSGAGGGPYYYKYTGPALVDNGTGQPNSASLTNLYKTANWTAVAVANTTVTINGQSVNQWQNWANWWAYYHTRNLMARTSLSRVFASPSLAATTADGGYGSSVRVAWQNLYTSDSFILGTKTLISALADTTPAACMTQSKSGKLTLGSQSQQSGSVTTAPACYRNDFFNWIFQVPALNGTPTRSATDRAGQFFMRGCTTKSGKTTCNTGGTGDLHDPYWQPPAAGTGDGDELSCRQNFHVLMTDGLWNGDGDGPKYAALTAPASTTQLPDGTQFPDPGTAGVTSIYKPVHDGGNANYASLSDIAFHYWATSLRPDLYDPNDGKFVAPYLPDTRTGVVPTSVMSSSMYTNNANVNEEIYFNPVNDPANWPHMSEYMIGLGVSGTLNQTLNTDCTDASGAGSDACNLRKGVANSSGKVGWPTPNGSGSGIAQNIDDTWHAGLAGRGEFFSAANPQNLVDQLSAVLSNISARAAQPSTSAINASVLTTGAIAFNTGYSSIDWTGVLQAFPLNADGTTGSPFLWDANDTLTNHTSSTSRKILTASKDATSGLISGMAFESGSGFDAAEKAGLNAPAATDTTNDTLGNRVNYLRGVRDEESTGVMRTRTSLLGAIINSQGVYLSYPASGYTNNWPAGSAEATAAATSNGTNDDKSYDAFVTNHSTRAPMFYVGANDGMLHAFSAPVPTCSTTDPTTGACTAYTGAGTGPEQFAYVPRAVYANLGNLTSASSFKYAPTVDGTPVIRDVFFSENSAAEWHTVLVGGLRLGGRGVYALDVTDPTKLDETTNGLKKVLWEFDSDSKVTDGCVVYGTAAQGNTACDPSHLGYTFGQPNVGRLASGQWVVIVPSGYFPDCSQTDRPAICNSPGYPTQPKDSGGVPYSSLFVLDAQTGAMLAELKTPSTSTVGSYGLTSPVLGDYNNDQIEDVGYAGDLAGNLWRFDFSGTAATSWKVTLAYQAPNQGYQPITVMPRLFPDPVTNRFMVVFGTGKYLGSGDNTSTSAQTQAIYGIRDTLDTSGNPNLITQGTLVQRYLYETTVTDSSDPNFGATLRGLCANSTAPTDPCDNPTSLASTAGGWRIDLSVPAASGERVVVTPAAIFASNTAIISTLIPGSSDPCNPNVQGAVMALDAATGGAGQGVTSLGGIPYIGARVNNVRTSGTLPVATSVGGGSLVVPGLTLTGKKNDSGTPLTLDAPIWRRRSWLELNNDQ